MIKYHKAYIAESIRKKMLMVLDGMAVALAGHNHKWTCKQRRGYEWAAKLLK